MQTNWEGPTTSDGSGPLVFPIRLHCMDSDRQLHLAELHRLSRERDEVTARITAMSEEAATLRTRLNALETRIEKDRRHQTCVSNAQLPVDVHIFDFQGSIPALGLVLTGLFKSCAALSLFRAALPGAYL